MSIVPDPDGLPAAEGAPHLVQLNDTATVLGVLLPDITVSGDGSTTNPFKARLADVYGLLMHAGVIGDAADGPSLFSLRPAIAQLSELWDAVYNVGSADKPDELTSPGEGVFWPRSFLAGEIARRRDRTGAWRAW